MIRYVIALAFLITLTSACCFPKQFHAWIGSSSLAQSRGGNRIRAHVAGLYYDYINGKVRIDDYTSRRVVISDFNKKKIYYSTTKRCYAVNIRVNMTRMCVPRNGVWLGKYNFGAGQLPFDIYGYYRKLKTSSYGWSWDVSQPKCIPMALSGFFKWKSRRSQGGRYYGSGWVNVTIGEPISSVFNPPSNCGNSGSRSLHVNEFDVQDQLTKILSKPSAEGVHLYENVLKHYFNVTTQEEVVNLKRGKDYNEDEDNDDEDVLRDFEEANDEDDDDENDENED